MNELMMKAEVAYNAVCELIDLADEAGNDALVVNLQGVADELARIAGMTDEEPWDGFNSDAEADADVLANAGWGTDEDYGYYGGEDY